MNRSALWNWHHFASRVEFRLAAITFLAIGSVALVACSNESEVKDDQVDEQPRDRGATPGLDPNDAYFDDASPLLEEQIDHLENRLFEAWDFAESSDPPDTSALETARQDLLRVLERQDALEAPAAAKGFHELWTLALQELLAAYDAVITIYTSSVDAEIVEAADDVIERLANSEQHMNESLSEFERLLDELP